MALGGAVFSHINAPDYIKLPCLVGQLASNNDRQQTHLFYRYSYFHTANPNDTLLMDCLVLLRVDTIDALYVGELE